MAAAATAAGPKAVAMLEDGVVGVDGADVVEKAAVAAGGAEGAAVAAAALERVISVGAS